MEFPDHKKRGRRMKRSRTAFLLPAGLLLTAFAATLPARADQIVYFVNGKAMTVKSVERGDRVTILEIDGGGRIGVPTVQIDRIEDLQLSAPAAATAAVVVPPPAPAPASVQPAANLQSNPAVTGNPIAPAAVGAVVTPPAGPAVDARTGLPNHGPGLVSPLGNGEADAVPPQALPPSYNAAMAARGGQYGAQAGGLGVGSRFNNNTNGVIGRPDGPGRGRINSRLGAAFGRVRPPVSAPPPAPPGQAQAPASPGSAAPATAPTGGSAAASRPPAAPQPPPANPEPPPDASQNDQGADNGAANPPAPEEPAPNDPPADENPPDGEN
jgi:hypothetical protein